MVGYLNDKEKTDEVVKEIDGIRWYNTGDKGHLDEDGFYILSIVILALQNWRRDDFFGCNRRRNCQFIDTEVVNLCHIFRR